MLFCVAWLHVSPPKIMWSSDLQGDFLFSFPPWHPPTFLQKIVLYMYATMHMAWSALTLFVRILLSLCPKCPILDVLFQVGVFFCRNPNGVGVPFLAFLISSVGLACMLSFFRVVGKADRVHYQFITISWDLWGHVCLILVAGPASLAFALNYDSTHKNRHFQNKQIQAMSSTVLYIRMLYQ